MKRIVFIILLIFSSGILVSCDKTFEFKTHVQTSEGIPIENAQVVVSGAGTTKSALTNDLGEASIFIDDSLVEQSGELRVSAVGYEPYTLNIDLIESNSPQDVALEIAEFEYKILVQSRGGIPIENAQVVVSGASTTKSALTNNLGEASIFIDDSLVGQSGDLRVSADGYELYSMNIELLEINSPQDVALEQNVNYRVHVQASDTGSPLENAQVTIDGAGSTKTAITDNLGNASILFDSSMVGQPGKLNVIADGHESFTLAIDLLVTNLPKDIPLTPIRSPGYEVLISDEESGMPIKNASISIRPDGGEAAIDGTSDDNGIIVLIIDASLIGKLGILTVEADGHKTYTENIKIDTDQLPSIIELKQAVIQEPIIIADFRNCSNTNNLGGEMGGAFDPPSSLDASYIEESGNACVARLDYNNSNDWSGFWLKLQGEDFSRHTTLSFDIRAETDLDAPDKIKIELKGPGDEIEVYILSDITTEWDTINIPFSDFGSAGYGNLISAYTAMSELTFVFTESLSGTEGTIYLDNIIVNP